MDTLIHKTCVPCQAGAPKLSESEIQDLKPQAEGWEVLEKDGEKKLKKEFKFENYGQSLSFVNNIGNVAEANGHHPVILFEFRKVTVWWWTHKIGGLHENDFIMAAKTNHIRV